MLPGGFMIFSAGAPGRAHPRTPARPAGLPGVFRLFSASTSAAPSLVDEDRVAAREEARAARLAERDRLVHYWREVAHLMPTARIAVGIHWAIPEPKAKSTSTTKPPAPKPEKDMSPLAPNHAPGLERPIERVLRLGAEKAEEVKARARELHAAHAETAAHPLPLWPALPEAGPAAVAALLASAPVMAPWSDTSKPTRHRASAMLDDDEIPF